MDTGFIGLGKMGQPMVRRLLAAGHSVHVYNRSPGATRMLVAQGATEAVSATQVAERAEIVMTALPTSETVDEVFSRLADVARPGQIYVDHSTVSPELSRQCAARIQEKGAAFLDAPVTGGPAGAESGVLTLLVGGDDEAFARAVLVFRAFGKTIRHCGPVGAGQGVKLLNQLLVGAHIMAIAEAAVFGAGLGVDLAMVLDLMPSLSGASTMVGRVMPRFLSRDFTPATPVSLIVKDLGLVREEAYRAGVPLLLGALAEQRFLEASARGLGDADMAALVQLYEEAAGQSLVAGAVSQTS
jgi:3-hydroxyisobutyrate dehydrogenase-like beta-hydroxyacid dehydrogenase